jgi:hypothetical protein
VVGQLVARVADVATHPDKFCLAGFVQRADCLDDVEVFDAALFVPTVGLPLQRPFGNNVYPELAVGINLAWLAGGVRERADNGIALHADIGRLGPARLAAQHHRLAAKYYGKSTRPRVRASATVGMIHVHAYAQVYRLCPKLTAVEYSAI